jgi:hypothetical protein
MTRCLFILIKKKRKVKFQFFKWKKKESFNYSDENET